MILIRRALFITRTAIILFFVACGSERTSVDRQVADKPIPASETAVVKNAVVYTDARNGYFTFIPPEEWKCEEIPDERTKVEFRHPNQSDVLIRFIVREASGENFAEMIQSDKHMADQMRSKGISCEVKENMVEGLRCSEIHAQIPGVGITMLRKFISRGLHFNIQYAAPSKTLFDEYYDAVMRSLATVVVLGSSRGDPEKVKKQRIAGIIRLAELTAECISVEEAKQILRAGVAEFPNDQELQTALDKMNASH